MEEQERLTAIENAKWCFPFELLSEFEINKFLKYLNEKNIDHKLLTIQNFLGSSKRSIECNIKTLPKDHYIYKSDYYCGKERKIIAGKLYGSTRYVGVLLNGTDFGIILNIHYSFPLIEKISYNENSDIIEIEFKNSFLDALNQSKYLYGKIDFSELNKEEKDFIKITYETKYSPVKSHYLNYYVLINQIRFELEDLEDVFYRIYSDNQLKYSSCLISHKMFNQYSIDNTIPKTKDIIIQYLSEKLDYLNKLDQETVSYDFINEWLNFRYKTHIESLDYNYNKINVEEDFYQLSQSLFINSKKKIRKEKSGHKFVNTNIKNLSNADFGRKAEIALNLYLKKHYSGNNWQSCVSETSNGNFCEITWNNEMSETYKPFDFLLAMKDYKYKIDVKATRGDNDNIFYLSIGELEEMISEPESYIIARLAYIEEEQTYQGIPINDDFYLNFYVFNDETIKIIKESIDGWKNFDQVEEISFTTEHLKIPELNYGKIQNKYKIFEKLKLDDEDIKYFEKYVFEKYLKKLCYNAEVYAKINVFKKSFEKFELLKNSNRFIINIPLIESLFRNQVSNQIMRFYDKPKNSDLPFSF